MTTPTEQLYKLLEERHTRRERVRNISLALEGVVLKQLQEDMELEDISTALRQVSESVNEAQYSLQEIKGMIPR